MKGYRQVRSKKDIQTLLQHTSGFHDSMMKELHLLNTGFVMANGSMDTNQRFDVRVLLQSQLGPGAVELVFVSVDRMEIGEGGEYEIAWINRTRMPRPARSESGSISTADGS